ncbi:hypothetical protein AXF42_Ash012854 [Apostasia shenzhenica]|uniref:Uncharacterized protein n=1 Tax=Apostasia shenzhenica TaxID=1088818 RepID=A0A2I0AMG1_9ASPA|nr:hypothetical protein AXF42_Ash012854 [Apostasia shenzhenica]
MGSLMAGWDAPSKDPKSDKFQRNRSLTKEEIEAYWKSKKRAEEEHLRAISGDQNENQENLHRGTADRMQRSVSLPLANRKESSMNLNDSKLDEHDIRMSRCWWTRSNWAFLNEPPVKEMEGPSYKYAAQYHVAELGRSRSTDNRGLVLNERTLQSN